MSASKRSKSRSNHSSKSDKPVSRSRTRTRTRTRRTRTHRRRLFKPVPKLAYMELPVRYEDHEPEFWKPLFKKNELFELKEKVRVMLAPDFQIKLVNKEVPELWSACKIVKRYFPSYFVPMKNKSYVIASGYTRDQEVDFSNYQILCCTSMLLFGILSARFVLKDQDYQLVFKGGKAIQMGLPTEYVSEDIDIVVEPIVEYDPVLIQNITGHLALLMKWLLPLEISVLPPGANPHIYKLSFQMSNHRFRPFADLDFKQIDPRDPFFKELDTDQYFIEPLDEHALFKRPTIEKILEEKIFYYTKYKRNLEQINQGLMVEGVDKRTCDYFMSKFKRAIQAIAPDTDVDRL